MKLSDRQWPDPRVEKMMLEDVALMESEFEPNSTGADCCVHIKALLHRVHDLQQDVDQLLPYYDAIAAMAAQYICPKTSPEQLMQEILKGPKP
jgi:hypothetical protein